MAFQINRTLLLGTAPLALAIACAAPAYAQDAAPATAAAPEQADEQIDNSTDDIIVVGTAGGGTRRQDAAFAVTSINAEDISRLAPSSTADLLHSVPGVSAESSGGQNGANIFVRGFPSGGDAEFVTLQSSGVPIFPPPTLSFLENTQLFRIDDTIARVEAVRGGTGALFSSGQPGLTVNFVQREGSQTPKGSVRISATDFGEVRGDAWVSGPLGANTTAMIGGYYAQSNGIRDPQFRAEKGGQITANIRHDFGKGSLLVYGRYLNDHGQWLLPVPVSVNGSKVSDFPGFDAQTGTLAGRETRFSTINTGRVVDLADGRGAKIFNGGVNFDYELSDGLKIRERASYMKGSADTVGLVPDAAPMTAADYVVAKYGAGNTVGALTYVNGGGVVPGSTPVIQAGIWEVRKQIESFVNDLSLEFKRGDNTLTVGGYFATYSSDDRWNLGNGQLLTAEEHGRRLNLTLGDGRQATRSGFVQGATFNVNAQYDGKDYAAYAVDEYQITPELRIDGGIRWQRHTVSGRLENNTFGVDTDNNPNTLYNNGTAVLNGTFSGLPKGDYSGSKVSWTAGINYDFSNQIGAFARYSRGNSFPFFDALRDGVTIAPKVDSYELGLKVSTPMVSAYATFFHNDFTGLGVSRIINNVPQISIGGARTNGIEFEGTIRPVHGLSIDLGATYLDAKYRNFFTSVDVSGLQVQRQPKWQWRVSPSYEHDFGGAKAAVFTTLSYIGDRFSDPENKQVLPKFYKLDAGVAVTVAEKIKLQVTGDNLTNRIGLTEGNPRVIGSQGGLARPILGRSFRFSVGYSF
ncbi:MAG: TonB-dependent receptor [Pseudomonadota bacterium]|uniref:TonB-dependent receptor domain-containing protein n=1 Tax=Sphingomonas sp. ERG5 TaxID=1381597 RepID=UPI00126A657B|nr:TonB-dependent receptor [Sphingomonas sp. ERG5]